jgi:photosystem II stability/assembly factor-like uncharacterized protein
VTITFIQMVSAAQGWALGNIGDPSDHVLRTADGGNTWWDISPPEATPQGDGEKRAEAFFLDSETAWVIYNPYEIIWQTMDGGMTWEPSISAYTGLLGAAFWFADKDHGWLMKYLDAGMSHVYVALFRTTTGGTYWEKIWDPTSSDDLQSFSKTGMVFFNANTGWVSRDSGGVQPGAFIDVTEDGGSTWQSLQLPPPEDDPDIFEKEYCGMHSPVLFTELSGALVVECRRFDGDERVSTSYLFSTTNSGQTWSRLDYPGGKLHFVDQNVAYALGQEIYQSQNGGRTWISIKSVNWDGQFSFVNRNLAWAVARDGEEIALVKTTDGCRSWEMLNPKIAASGTPP